MSGYNDNYSDLFDGEGQGRQDGSGLRKQLEEALAEIRSLRSDLTKEKRAKTLTDLFAEKGKDPAAAALVPEGADPKEWLDKFGGLLADVKKEAPKVEDQQQPPAPEVPDPALIQEQMAMETLQGLTGPGTGIPSTATADPIAKMNSFDNEADLMAYIRSQGVAD